mmetsp:Transcript_25454/g.73494  ORF Transcript_25454/g.73494 Transcript_25454/m.73494 type:complete len:243 (+) Transcript_25454:62-790(+)
MASQGRRACTAPRKANVRRAWPADRAPGRLRRCCTCTPASASEGFARTRAMRQPGSGGSRAIIFAEVLVLFQIPVLRLPFSGLPFFRQLLQDDDLHEDIPAPWSDDDRRNQARQQQLAGEWVAHCARHRLQAPIEGVLPSEADQDGERIDDDANDLGHLPRLLPAPCLPGSILDGVQHKDHCKSHQGQEHGHEHTTFHGRRRQVEAVERREQVELKGEPPGCPQTAPCKAHCQRVLRNLDGP